MGAVECSRTISYQCVCASRMSVPRVETKLMGSKTSPNFRGMTWSISLNFGSDSSWNVIKSKRNGVAVRRIVGVNAKAAEFEETVWKNAAKAANAEETVGNGSAHEKRKKVVVVGAGWAGLGAAHHLSKQVAGPYRWARKT
jgi:hypothetical protein